MKRDLIPADWSTWGHFPGPSEKDLHTYNVIWRAFSPDHSYIIHLRWRPEQNPKGSMIVELEVDQNWLNPMYVTKVANVKELTQAVEEIMGKLPDPSIVKLEARTYAKSGGRTSTLEASSVVKKQKRKYTKKSARWSKKSAFENT